MMRKLFHSYISDEVNEDGPFSLTGSIPTDAPTVTFLLTASVSPDAPEEDAGGVTEVVQCETINGTYELVPGAIAEAIGRGAFADTLVTVPYGELLEHLRVRTRPYGTNNPRGGGAVAISF